MPIISEVMAVDQVRRMAEIVDILQVGARNMQNFDLLRELGKVDRPILLKRGLSSTIEEWLGAAEYILAIGNQQVMLCERGIRTFETSTRNTLDLSAIPVLRERTHLPVIVDPSHGTGYRAYVAPMARAARAAGAHGLLIEVHPDPDKALSDAAQSLSFAEFLALMRSLERCAPGQLRRACPPPRRGRSTHRKPVKFSSRSCRSSSMTRRPWMSASARLPIVAIVRGSVAGAEQLRHLGVVDEVAVAAGLAQLAGTCAASVAGTARAPADGS